MDDLLEIKKTLENQISVATGFLNEALATEVQEYIQHLESKIEAWNEILEVVDRKIEYAERELEALGIFQANNSSTYLS